MLRGPIFLNLFKTDVNLRSQNFHCISCWKSLILQQNFIINKGVCKIPQTSKLCKAIHLRCLL